MTYQGILSSAILLSEVACGDDRAYYYVKCRKCGAYSLYRIVAETVPFEGEDGPRDWFTEEEYWEFVEEEFRDNIDSSIGELGNQTMYV